MYIYNTTITLITLHHAQCIRLGICLQCVDRTLYRYRWRLNNWYYYTTQRTTSQTLVGYWSCGIHLPKWASMTAPSSWSLVLSVHMTTKLSVHTADVTGTTCIAGSHDSLCTHVCVCAYTWWSRQSSVCVCVCVCVCTFDCVWWWAMM